MLPVCLLTVPSSVAVSVLTSRLGRFRWAIWIGYTIATLSCGLIIMWSDKTKTAVWAVCECLFGLGIGMILSAVNYSVQAAVGSAAYFGHDSGGATHTS